MTWTVPSGSQLSYFPTGEAEKFKPGGIFPTWNVSFLKALAMLQLTDIVLNADKSVASPPAATSDGYADWVLKDAYVQVALTKLVHSDLIISLSHYATAAEQ
ncbi:hypothetical protein AAF712_015843 [Marasmius tenuissimus]|uniref:Uncharacterized protein n=1 Tax=Marasmius tenuissimus TaxID=585030 RepID=A0ABR2Z756_9AGAR